jgi:hypothetical protein
MSLEQPRRWNCTVADRRIWYPVRCNNQQMTAHLSWTAESSYGLRLFTPLRPTQTFRPTLRSTGNHYFITAAQCTLTGGLLLTSSGWSLF